MDCYNRYRTLNWIHTHDIEMLWKERQLQEIKEFYDRQHLRTTTNEMPFSGELEL